MKNWVGVFCIMWIAFMVVFAPGIPVVSEHHDASQILRGYFALTAFFAALGATGWTCAVK